MIKLPFFDKKHKIWVGLLGLVLALIFYTIPNRIQIFETSYLTLFNIEKALPFIDWTIWIYISFFIYIILVFILLKQKENMNRLFYAQMLLLFVSMIIYYLFPIGYPRPTVELNGIASSIVNFYYSIDTPNNAWPSLHVGLTFLAGFGFLKEKKHLFPIFMIWAVLISISTLTIKQHYLWDVITGFVLAVFFYYFSLKFIKDKYSLVKVADSEK